MYEQAIDEAKTTLELNPDYPVAWLTLGQTYLDMGRVDEAIEAHEHLRDNRFWAFMLAVTLATAGRDEDAAIVLEFVKKGKNNPFTLALIYGGLGDREETMKWLQAAKDQKIPWFPWQVTWFPQTRFLHEDPRMLQFAAELGIEFPN
jgi:tetratricopeptide (TPR) repeat protein